MCKRAFVALAAALLLLPALQGQDVGQQINDWYAALPPQGGVIHITQSASFSTPICFCTPGKRIGLAVDPGVTLTYTGIGTAITFDYGMGHEMNHGVSGLTLTGPGETTNTVGIQFGGNNGAEGIGVRDFKVEGFGVGAVMESHTWLARFEHGIFRGSGINLLLPSGLTEAGEQIEFDHVTFADAPPPHTNSVWVQGGGQEVIFRDCSFDQAQVRIGNGRTSAAQVVIAGSHFEDSNYMVPGSVPYMYLVVDENHGNFVRLTDDYFFEGGAHPPPAFFVRNGGIVVVSGVGGWSPSHMYGFITGPGVVTQRGLVSLGGVGQ